MSDDSPPGLAVRAVDDPGTPGADLATIAHEHPALRAQVAAHPKAYPGLLDWLETFGDQAVVAAVQARRARDAAQASTVQTPPAEPGAGPGPSQAPATTGAVGPAAPPPGPAVPGVVLPQPWAGAYPQPASTGPWVWVVGALVVLLAIGALAVWVLASGPGNGTSGDAQDRQPDVVVPPQDHGGQTNPSTPRATQQVPPSDAGVRTYTNTRYGFSVTYPASLAVVRDGDNGDGRTWASSDGQVVLVAYGRNNVAGQSSKQLYDAAVAARKAAGDSLTYTRQTDKFFVVSGYQRDGSAYYEVSWVGPGSINTMSWLSPPTMQVVEDWITDAYHAFVPGDLTVGH